MGSFSIWHLVIFVFWLLFFFIPLVLIVRKAGFSGWWSLLALMPIVNVIALWVFATTAWPISKNRI